MKKVDVVAYVTEDGKKFFSEVEAKAYEERIKNIKFYEVKYSPDLNETGNLMKFGYVKVQARWARELWLEDWLYGKFGSRVAFVQGSAPTWNWSYREVSLREVEKDELLTHLVK